MPYPNQDLKHNLIVSNDLTNYLLITEGWQKGLRVYGCVTHLEIIGDKIWIQRDGLEDGIANYLVAAGIPKSQIVLGFHPPEIRPYTEYAVE